MCYCDNHSSLSTYYILSNKIASGQPLFKRQAYFREKGIEFTQNIHYLCIIVASFIALINRSRVSILEPRMGEIFSFMLYHPLHKSWLFYFQKLPGSLYLFSFLKSMESCFEKNIQEHMLVIWEWERWWETLWEIFKVCTGNKKNYLSTILTLLPLVQGIRNFGEVRVWLTFCVSNFITTMHVCVLIH